VQQFKARASAVFAGFDAEAARFAHYRSVISQERRLFSEQVRSVFRIKHHA
jgi:hypothetical protein